MAAALVPTSSGIRSEAFMTRVVVLVDEATEPSLPEEDAARRRTDLVSMANSASQNAGVGVGASSAGFNIAYAIRKRLKSDDSAAVMNTLKLLDELMRSCPYFYRYVADDKMFRRLWRFVVPDYKNGMRAMLPFAHRGRTAADLRATAGRPDIAVKVLILIRAWAEELAVLYNGRYDPSAGFLIERYNSKRVRIKFPEVPKTEHPWVCPVGSNANQSAYTASGASSSGARRPNGNAPNLPESLSFGEVENTVNLFENMIDNATDIAELKSDVTKELANRCRLILQNIDRLSMSMDKEEELTRAIKVSEKLSRSLASYDNSIRTDEISKPIPIVSGTSRGLDSDDDTYDNSRMATSSAEYRSDQSEDAIAPRKHYASSSQRPLPDLPRPPTSRSKRSVYRSLDRSHSHDSHLNALASNRLDDLRDGEATPRERREEAQRKFHRDYVASKKPNEPPRRERSSSSSPSYMADGKKKGAKSRRREERGQEERDEIKPQEDGLPALSKKTHDSGKKKSSKRDPKKATSAYVTTGSSSSAKTQKKSKERSTGKKLERSMSALPGATTLVDVSAPDNHSVDTDSSSDIAKKDDIFALLGERYGTGKSESSQDPNVQLDSEQGLQQLSGGIQNVNLTTQQPPTNMYQSTNPAAMQTNMPPYGSVVMMQPPMGMPNPLAMSMYGSVNPMMQQNPAAAMYAAYNTINPAMYYNSVNPLAYATQNPNLGMGGQFGNPFMQQQMQQQPMQQQPQAPAQQQMPQFGQAAAAHSATSQPAQSAAFAQPLQPQQLQQPQMYQSPDMTAKSFAEGRAASLPPIQRSMMMEQSSTLSAPPPPPPPSMYTTVTNAPAPPPNMAPPPPMPSTYTTVTNAPAPPPNAAPPPMQRMDRMSPGMAAMSYQSVNMGGIPQRLPQPGQAETAAAIQATMANAAAMYNAAAVAYQSVSGHAPLQPPMQPQMMMGMAPAMAQPMQQPIAHPQTGGAVPFMGPDATSSGVRTKH